MDSGDEDELTTGSRDFYKMREKLFKAGYVDGATAAEETAQHTFRPQQANLVALYMEVGKLIGVVESAISINLETDETPLRPFLAKLNHYACTLRLNTNTNETPSWAIIRRFVDEFKTVYPDAATLVETLFNESEPPTSGMNMNNSSGCGDPSCKCINGISVDLNKLSF